MVCNTAISLLITEDLPDIHPIEKFFVYFSRFFSGVMLD
jgi:hypothetical protein